MPPRLTPLLRKNSRFQRPSSQVQDRVDTIKTPPPATWVVRVDHGLYPPLPHHSRYQNTLWARSPELRELVVAFQFHDGRVAASVPLLCSGVEVSCMIHLG